MKINAIRGKNLASLEKDFEVDFTAEPLKSAGIFAITGSTGSGKSTLLDALCIALFDTSPRTNNASESIALRDVGDKTINQGDSRTILRRGAVEGYAEVDFVSLGNEKYRSRWSVRRAYNKADGSLQSSEIRLYNLTAEKEEQGSKKELLGKISGLIGLTFDQFTRSVLLAQGDFATFLKAKQAEKAELLEKLTGTSVFSKISIAIFEKAKDAETKYNLLNDRIKDVELLSAEQTDAYETEKRDMLQTLSALKKEAEQLMSQLKWIDENIRLQSLVKRAETDYFAVVKAIEEAGKRFAYIAQMEEAQSIRDTFGLLKNVQKQLSDDANHLQTAQTERETIGKRLTDAQKTLSELENQEQQLQNKQKEIAPQIIQARELDVQIKAAKAAFDDAQKDFNTATSVFNKTNTNLTVFKQAHTQTEKSLSAVKQWLDDNKKYESIVANVALLSNLATDAQTAKGQREQNEKTLASNRQLLEEKQKQLEKLKQEAERLNQLLPAEIAALRDLLIEGEPCPVCGSTHHPIAKADVAHRMKEQELKRAKDNNTQQTETVSLDIENRKNEITRLSAQIENYTNLYDESYRKLALYLSGIPEWKGIFDNAGLSTWLTSLSAQWKNNTDALTKTGEELNKLATQIENEAVKLKEAEAHLSEKTKRLNEFRTITVQLAAERANVLHGKPADDAEKYFVDNQRIITEKLKKATDTKNTLVAGQESLNGVIIQMQTNIRQSETKRAALQNETDVWLNARENFSESLLTELLSRSTSWIHGEKQALQSLTEAETTVKATLAERLKNLSLHNNSEAKPENESKEELQTLLHAINDAIETQNKRTAEIDMIVLSNEKSKAVIKALEKELNEKGTLAENWKKLNQLFGSATGNKFKEVAQGYTLETLLTYANKHLQELAPRYKLQSLPDTLGLQVTDTDMLNEVRSIHTLSGGESFLTSLALALGLSSLSSNRMKVESLFIDEGFGSLDSDTLRVAMDALEHLQTQGRKIGVISHVAEMTERIAVRIKVRKTSNDKSEIEIS